MSQSVSSYSIKNIFLINCYILGHHLVFQYFDSKCLISFDLSAWQKLVLMWIFYFFAKVYPWNFWALEIWNPDTDFSINVHWYCLLLQILLKRYTNAYLKIYWYACALLNMPNVWHYSNFFFLIGIEIRKFLHAGISYT